MKPVLKWSLIGCGCVGSGLLALIVLVVIVGAFANSSGTTTVTTVGTATPSAAKPAAEKPAPPAAAPTAAPIQKPAAAPAKPEPKVTPLAKVGDRVESGGIALTVNGIRKAGELGQFMKAKPGRTYAVVDVLLETIGREKSPYNPLYFKIKDADGYEYNGTGVGAENALKSGELAQGEKVRGTVSFDVPSEAKGLVLSYQPLVILGGYQVIRVQLE